MSAVIEPSRELRDVCAIVGAGNSRLGRVPGVSSLDLLVEAMRNAIADAGLKVSDIDGIVCRGPDESYCHHQRVGERLGINARFSTTLDNGGASQIMSVALATMAIKAGLASTVICGYGRDAWSRTHSSEEARVRNETRPESLRAQEFGPEYGYFGAVAAHAFGATRHMHLYGTTREHFGQVAVAFREHALRNPDAQMKKPLSIAQYHEAPADRGAFRIVRLQPAQRRRRRGDRHQPRTRARSASQPPVSIKGFGSYNNLTGWFSGDNMVVTAAKDSGEVGLQDGGYRPGRRELRAAL